MVSSSNVTVNCSAAGFGANNAPGAFELLVAMAVGVTYGQRIMFVFGRDLLCGLYGLAYIGSGVKFPGPIIL
ncbi:hypothetical protein D3C71_1145270 [compost metagenome]